MGAWKDAGICGDGGDVVGEGEVTAGASGDATRAGLRGSSSDTGGERERWAGL